MNPFKEARLKDVLIGQYRELIHAAILESEIEHRTRTDIGKLNSKLKVIYKAAQYDGLNDSVISELIDQEISLKPKTFAA